MALHMLRTLHRHRLINYTDKDIAGLSFDFRDSLNCPFG